MVHFLLSISPAIRILSVFGLILLLNRVRVPLGLGLVLGGVGLDCWAGRPVDQVGGHLAAAVVRPELWLMMLNITLILEFGYFMASERNSRILLAAAQRVGGRHGRLIGLMFVPAAIGMVPMPGGALFSAPLVGQAVQDRPMPAAWKTAVNYWFRHILEYWWPLYPVVIVSLSIFSLPVWQFFLLQMPFTLVSLLAGWFFLLRNHAEYLGDSCDSRAELQRNELLAVVLPILFIVLCTLILPPLVEQLVPGRTSVLYKLLAMLFGLLVALGVVSRQRENGLDARLFSHLFSFKTMDVVCTLGGVMIFQTMLEYSGLLGAAGREMSASAVPVELVIAFLPFLAGLVTGIAVGFGGPAFPLVVGLAAGNPEMGQGAALVLAFAMGYAGMMLSPVHLCYLLTRRYFTVSLAATWPYLVPCVLSVVGWGIVLHIVLRFLGW